MNKLYRDNTLQEELWKMTTTQIKKEIKGIKEMIENLLEKVEETRDDIEPYDGHNDLTAKQEMRLEWLEKVADCFDNLIYELDELDENYE